MDISYKINNNNKHYRFNYRVAAIIEADGKILIHKFTEADFYFLPGGRVKVGETTQEAIVRELEEELSVKVKTSSLPFVVENFFDYKGEIFHEVSMYFTIESVNIDNLPKDGEERGKVQFLWKTKDDISNLNLQPEFLAEELKEIPENTKHIINFGDNLIER